MKSARFPMHDDLAGFDFTVSQVDRASIQKLADLSLITIALAPTPCVARLLWHPLRGDNRHCAVGGINSRRQCAALWPSRQWVGVMPSQARKAR